MKYQNSSEVIGPRPVYLKDILLNILWTFISWCIWSFLMFILVIIVSKFIDIQTPFKSMELWISQAVTPVYPFIFSFIVSGSLILVWILTYIFLSLIDPLKFKKTIIHFSQIVLLFVLIYIFILPIYIFAWINDTKDLIMVFIFHSLVAFLWLGILIEILNNYRYILLGFFSSFVSLFLTSFVVYLTFSIFSDGYAKLLSLLFFLPLINISTLLFKQLAEFVYYKYYKLTGYDNLWDIFKQIEKEEIEEYEKAIQEHSTY